jgi:hypothetical protein
LKHPKAAARAAVFRCENARKRIDSARQMHAKSTLFGAKVLRNNIARQGLRAEWCLVDMPPQLSIIGLEPVNQASSRSSTS